MTHSSAARQTVSWLDRVPFAGNRSLGVVFPPSYGSASIPGLVRVSGVSMKAVVPVSYFVTVTPIQSLLLQIGSSVLYCLAHPNQAVSFIVNLCYASYNVFHTHPLHALSPLAL